MRKLNVVKKSIIILFVLIFSCSAPLYVYAGDVPGEGAPGGGGGYTSWIKVNPITGVGGGGRVSDKDASGGADAGVYVPTNPHTFRSDSEKNSKTFDALLADAIYNAGAKFHDLLYDDDSSLDLTMGNAIAGEVARFTLNDKNMYGLAGARIYVAFRGVVFALYFIYAAWLLLKQAFKSSSKGMIELKEGVINIIFSYLMIYLFPQMVQAVIAIINALTNKVLAALATETPNGKTLDFSLLMQSTQSVYVSGYHTVPVALIYVAFEFAIIFFIVYYVTVAFTEAILFGFFPVINLLGLKNKKLMTDFYGTFFSNLCIPLIDAALFTVPFSFFGRLSGTGTFEENESLYILILITIWCIQPARNGILRVLGNAAGVASMGHGMGALMAMARMMGGGARRMLHGDINKGGEGGNDLSDADKAQMHQALANSSAGDGSGRDLADSLRAADNDIGSANIENARIEDLDVSENGGSDSSFSGSFEGDASVSGVEADGVTANGSADIDADASIEDAAVSGIGDYEGDFGGVNGGYDDDEGFEQVMPYEDMASISGDGSFDSVQDVNADDVTMNTPPPQTPIEGIGGVETVGAGVGSDMETGPGVPEGVTTQGEPLSTQGMGDQYAGDQNIDAQPDARMQNLMDMDKALEDQKAANDAIATGNTELTNLETNELPKIQESVDQATRDYNDIYHEESKVQEGLQRNIDSNNNQIASLQVANQQMQTRLSAGAPMSKDERESIRGRMRANDAKIDSLQSLNSSLESQKAASQVKIDKAEDLRNGKLVLLGDTQGKISVQKQGIAQAKADLNNANQRYANAQAKEATFASRSASIGGSAASYTNAEQYRQAQLVSNTLTGKVDERGVPVDSERERRARSIVNHKNFDTKTMASMTNLTEQEKADFYAQRARNDARIKWAKRAGQGVVDVAGVAAGVAGGVAGATAMMYGGAGAMMAGTVVGSSVASGAVHKVADVQGDGGIIARAAKGTKELVDDIRNEVTLPKQPKQNRLKFSSTNKQPNNKQTNSAGKRVKAPDTVPGQQKLDLTGNQLTEGIKELNKVTDSNT